MELNSSLILLKGVPLMPDYKHTLYFTSASEQQEYFASKTFKGFSNTSYIRVNETTLKVQANFYDVMECSYLMLKNDNYSNKWYYCFILDVEYINDKVVNIIFDVDLLQTFHFDYVLKDSFVDREHTIGDIIHTHTLPEQLEKGEYFFTDFDYGDELMNNFQIFVTTSTNVDGTPSQGRLISGVYTACNTLVYSADDTGVSQVNQLINDLTLEGKADSIISISMIPESTGFEVEIDRANVFTGLLENPYIPKNNKLYTYPYQYCYVATSDGEIVEYPFEYFLNGKAKFKIRRVGASPIQYVCTPLNYRGLAENTNEEIVLKVNNLCSWNIDTYKNWLAFDSLDWGFRVASTGANAIVGAKALKGKSGVDTLASMQYVSNTLGEVGNLVDEITTAYIAPPQLRGQNTVNVDILRKTFGFKFGTANITAGYANSIDNYFTKYGYKANYNKVPNRYVRENFTFTRTVDCNIVGNIATRYKLQICNIYNNGVTFWRNPQNFGNYNVSNKPLSEG